MRKELELRHPDFKFYPDKENGEVSCQWKPLVKVEPAQGGEPPKLALALANLHLFKIDKGAVVDAVRSFYGKASATEWSV